MNKSYLLVIIAVVVVGLVAAFHLTSSSTPLAAAQSQIKTFDLVVATKKLISGPSVLTVNQGDSVTIHITNDTDEELHLHGYNLMVDLKQNTPASLSFVASSSGRFPYELEHSSTDIGELDVQPK